MVFKSKKMIWRFLHKKHRRVLNSFCRQVKDINSVHLLDLYYKSKQFYNNPNASEIEYQYYKKVLKNVYKKRLNEIRTTYN